MSRQGPAALLSLKGRMANSASDNSVPGTIAAAETARAARPTGAAGAAAPRPGVHDWTTRVAAVSSLAAQEETKITKKREYLHTVSTEPSELLSD